MPNKTIYVSDGDLSLFQRAQDIAGGNLSAAISSALRRYVDVEKGREEGYDEISVRVGLKSGKSGRKVRFSGILVGEWFNPSASRAEVYRVYRGRTGKYVIHIERQPDWWVLDAEGKPAGKWSWLGLGNYTYGSIPGESTIEVVDSLEALKDKLPPDLYEMVVRSTSLPAVEDLDI